jgi:hypothetical protein
VGLHRLRRAVRVKIPFKPKILTYNANVDAFTNSENGILFANPVLANMGVPKFMADSGTGETPRKNLCLSIDGKVLTLPNKPLGERHGYAWEKNFAEDKIWHETSRTDLRFGDTVHWIRELARRFAGNERTTAKTRSSSRRLIARTAINGISGADE